MDGRHGFEMTRSASFSFSGDPLDDPVLAKELAKILSEVEADGEDPQTPPTMPPSDGASLNTPQELAGPSKCSSVSAADLPARTSVNQDTADALEEGPGSLMPTPRKALQVRPGSAHCGLECGPGTLQRWMPKADPSHDHHTARWAALAESSRTTGGFTGFGPAMSSSVSPTRGLATSLGSSVKQLPASMPELLRHMWAARAVEDLGNSDVFAMPFGREWRHGEIYFEETGKVCRFLVAPPGDLEGAEVAQALLEPSFGLTRPEMLFSLQSKLGEYWAADEDLEALRKCGVPWPTDVEEARRAYYRALETGVLGVCSAAMECGAWLIGSGCRTGGTTSGALFEAGIRRFARANPDRENEVAFLGMCGPCRTEAVERAGLRLEPGMCPWSTLVNPVTGELIDLRQFAVPVCEEVVEQVRYPDVGDLWARKAPADKGTNAETIGCLCLNPSLSHLLLCSDLVKCKVQDLLERLVPSVHIVVGASSRACLDHAIEHVLRGSQVVVFQDLGVWPNALAKAALERRGNLRLAAAVALGAGSAVAKPFALPGHADGGRFVILDALALSEEAVVERLTDAVKVVAGEDERELGFATNERQRLQHAWDLYLLYNLNGQRMWFWSRVAHYTIVLISLLTTTCAVLLTAASLPEAGSSALSEAGQASILSHEQVRFGRQDSIALALACSLLPLLSAFLLSANSRFSPRTHHAAFAAAAAKIRTAIFRYRARVGEFQPRPRCALLGNDSLGLDDGWAGLPVRSQPLGMGGARRGGPPPPDCRPRQSPTPPFTAATGAAAPALRDAAAAEWALAASPETTVLSPAAGGGCSMAPRGELRALRRGTSEASRAGRSGSQASERYWGRPSERFAEVLGAIHTELMAGVARMVSVAEPRPQDREWLHLQRSLGHHWPGITPRTYCPCSCRRSGNLAGGKVAPETTAAETDAWDAFSHITADEYLHARLTPLIAGLKFRAPVLGWLWASAQTTTFLGTGLAAAFSVFNMREFIPIVVAFVSAVDSVAQFEQLQVRMVAANGALAELQGLFLWWNALTLADRRRDRTKEHLVTVTEDMASSEAALLGCSARYQVPPQFHSASEDDEFSKSKTWRA